MAVHLPNGTTIQIAATYDADLAVSALSNAKPPVATTTGATLAAGDIVEVTSGWAKLAGRIARVASPTATEFSLDGFDTTDTDQYPAGGGAGSVRKILTWQQISQILDSSQSGGDQQYWNYNFLEDTGDERQMPTQRSAKAFTLSIADDPSLAQNAVLQAASDSRTPRALKLAFPDGSFAYWNAYVSFDSSPTLTRNQGMAVSLAITLAAQATRYSA